MLTDRSASDVLSIQPTPTLLGIGHHATRGGEAVSVIVRRVPAAAVARCQLCPKSECALLADGSCVVITDGFVSEIDAPLFARTGSRAAGK